MNAQPLHRRSLLAGGLGLALAGQAHAAKRGFFASRRLPIGLQLYTLAEAARADIEGVLARVAQIGFRSIELAGLHGQTPEKLRAAADKAGLALTSVHVQARGSGREPSLETPPAQFAAVMRTLGVTDAVLPMMPTPQGVSPRRGEGYGAFVARIAAEQGVGYWRDLARLLNDRARALREEGIRLGYHNHNVEFAPFGGTTGWEILVAETDPKLVHFELDAGWVAAAGLDPVKEVKKLAGRVRQMHVKDIRPSTKPNFALTQDPTEVGSGVIDWKRLLPAAYDAGVRQFYVEQEPPFATTRFDAVAKSFGYLSTKV
jgi:sugar phosphate isomerase/epimerase